MIEQRLLQRVQVMLLCLYFLYSVFEGVHAAWCGDPGCIVQGLQLGIDDIFTSTFTANTTYCFLNVTNAIWNDGGNKQCIGPHSTVLCHPGSSITIGGISQLMLGSRVLFENFGYLLMLRSQTDTYTQSLLQIHDFVHFEIKGNIIIGSNTVAEFHQQSNIKIGQDGSVQIGENSAFSAFSQSFLNIYGEVYMEEDVDMMIGQNSNINIAANSRLRVQKSANITLSDQAILTLERGSSLQVAAAAGDPMVFIGKRAELRVAADTFCGILQSLFISDRETLYLTLSYRDTAVVCKSSEEDLNFALKQLATEV